MWFSYFSINGMIYWQVYTPWMYQHHLLEHINGSTSSFVRHYQSWTSWTSYWITTSSENEEVDFTQHLRLHHVVENASYKRRPSDLEIIVSVGRWLKTQTQQRHGLEEQMHPSKWTKRGCYGSSRCRPISCCSEPHDFDTGTQCG